MLIDKTFDEYDPASMGEAAAATERLGYDGILLGEAAFDPFLALGLAAQATTRVQLATGVAIALPRSPTHVAYTAHDLQALSGGRFVLGLGSQVKAHVVRRFGATWTKPVQQMREFVLALRAIWAAWDDGAGIDFRGDHYQITLMTPYFTPRAPRWPIPPIWLAAVGPLMCGAAGEVADGVFLHPFSSLTYMEECSIPWIDAGRVRAGVAEPRQLAMPVMVATGEGAAFEQADLALRKQLAFYASTPAYRPVLDVHGWGDLQPELTRLSKLDEWDAMTSLIDEEFADTFAVRGDPEHVGKEIVRRFEHVLTRVSIYTPGHAPSAEVTTRVLDSIRQHEGGAGTAS